MLRACHFSTSWVADSLLVPANRERRNFYFNEMKQFLTTTPNHSDTLIFLYFSPREHLLPRA